MINIQFRRFFRSISNAVLYVFNLSVNELSLKKGNFKRRRFSGSVRNVLFGQNSISICLAILLLTVGGVPKCKDTEVRNFTAIVIRFVDNKQGSNFRDVKHRSLCKLEDFIKEIT